MWIASEIGGGPSDAPATTRISVLSSDALLEAAEAPGTDTTLDVHATNTSHAAHSTHSTHAAHEQLTLTANNTTTQHTTTTTDRHSSFTYHCGTLGAEAFVSARKSDADIAEIHQRVRAMRSRKAAREVKAFYERQNEQIDEMLKPVQEAKENNDDQLFQVKIAIYGSLAANLVLFCLQLFAATSSGSLSLFATMTDAFMDLASNLVLVFANVTSSKRNAQKFPAGKKRFETAAIVVFSCIMGALAVQLIIEGGKALTSEGHTTDLNATNLSCIGVAVVVKACLYFYCVALSKYPSAAILAQDHRNDIVLNITGIALSILGQKFLWWLDPAGGILIATWILINWGQTAIEHVQMFIGRAPPPLFLNRVTYLAMTHHDDILQVDTVRAYSSGAGYFVEVDIVLDPLTPLQKSHDIGEALQNKIETLDDVERAFVHMDYESLHTPEHSC
ncbi:hypothetical protein HDU98_003093 [Podochytrium sp. JEL0797]|nr:hypothetical protein HDU98_003093 [Podochytrium sp. JEL0797]